MRKLTVNLDLCKTEDLIKAYEETSQKMKNFRKELNKRGFELKEVGTFTSRIKFVKVR